MSGHEETATETTGEGNALERRIGNAVLRARLALLWEQLWPHLALTIAIAALFAGLSFVGFWPLLPNWLRITLVALFGLAFVASLIPIGGIAWPDRRAGLARVEKASGLTHRPLTALEDHQAGGTEDAASRALWQAHRKNAARRLDRLVAGIPSPQAFRRDPFALRTIVGALLFAGLFTANGAYLTRLGDAFHAPPSERTGPAPMRLDAWVNPPAYTGRPPVFLTGDTAAGAEEAIVVPAGSILVARAQGGDPVAVTLLVDGEETGLEPEGKPDDTAPPAQTPDRQEFRTRLDTDGEVHVSRNGEPLVAWRFSVTPDTPPVIALAGEPGSTASGALTLTYSATDDFGVTAAKAEIAAADDADPQARPLFEAPTFPLALPARGAPEGTGRTLRDLSAHPFSGGTVRLTLTARDAAGQEGRSTPLEFVLPERHFSKPLARALVEQRRILALDARDRHRVVAAIDALMIAPERFTPDAGTYLGLRFAYRELVRASTDDALRDVVELLWTLALTIEDGDLSLARRELRDAQEALKKALEEGASEEEIKRLTKDLRAALDRFLNAVQRQARSNPQQAAPFDPNRQTIDRRDLERMLDQIDQLARSGARDAAQQLLAEMQRMMENLETGQQGPMDQRAAEMSQMMKELGDMIARQRALMDETFELDQRDLSEGRPGERSDRDPQSGMTEQERQQALERLRERQQALQQQLEAMLERMREMGVEAGKELGQANRSMQGADENLGQGEPGPAVGDQGDALSALQQGAGKLLDQMMAEGRGNGRGGMSPGQQGRGGNDPLGRNRGFSGSEPVKIPDEIDIQRARRILEELRRRLDDRSRPRPELDYLDRLLPSD